MAENDVTLTGEQWAQLCEALGIDSDSTPLYAIRAARWNDNERAQNDKVADNLAAKLAHHQRLLTAEQQAGHELRVQQKAALAAAVERAEAAEAERDALRAALRQGVKYAHWHLGDMASPHGIRLLRRWADNYGMELNDGSDD